MHPQNETLKALFSMPVIVAALGYFVDIYDLILFGIVRVSSLRELGLSDSEITTVGANILNMQMAGMLVGGVLWGVLGDKKGRMSVLLGSIILYSAANLLNGFVQDVNSYMALRFIAGIGLAGELGAGVTLVSELLPKRIRGYGTMVIATVGVTGAIAANIIAQNFDWRTAYIIGGVMGFALLLMRVGLIESQMFKTLQHSGVKRGAFFDLFKKKELFVKYIKSIMIGLPLWFCVGILVLFSPEFAKELGIKEAVNAGNAVMLCYIGLTLGDFLSGFMSQKAQSRRKIIFVFMGAALALSLIYLNLQNASSELFYALCFGIGVACGYWALFITVAAEQFGTNIRSTVASTVPNFVRGMVVPMSLAFLALKPFGGVVFAAAIVGGVVFVIGFAALYWLEETFHKELDYVEI
ncbi:MAG TPA: MFS transporter [Campylobacterales bacterium]|nr:MFS transporter [Campylobacterales bacterium]